MKTTLTRRPTNAEAQRTLSRGSLLGVRREAKLQAAFTRITRIATSARPVRTKAASPLRSATAVQIFAPLLFGALALMPFGLAAATNDLSSTLQRGLFEEEANRNLDAAAQAYQTVSAQFDKDRALAATAIFRLGEIYRKQNKTNEAAVQYERIVREFSDQNTLVTLSRQNLAGLRPSPVPGDVAMHSGIGNASEETTRLAAQLKGIEQLKDNPEEQARAVYGMFPDEGLATMLRNLPFLKEQSSKLGENPDPNNVKSWSFAVNPDGIAVGGFGNVNGFHPKKEIEGQLSLIAKRVDFILGIQKARLQVLQSVAATSPTREVAVDAQSVPTTDEEEKEIRRIQEMLRNSPDLINGAPTQESPLSFAARSGYTRLAKSLLDNGADINRARGDQTPLLVAVQAGHKAMVELLVQRGADVNLRNIYGQTALHVAAESGFQAVAKALLAAKANVNCVSANQSTPLLLAAGKGHADLVRFLISQGAEVDAPNGNGSTPLMSAAQQGHTETVSALLSAKASPDTVDKEGRTALSYAAAGGHLETVKALLTAKADPNAGSMSLPLHAAIHQKSAAVVEALLRAGADPNRVANIRWQFTETGQPFRPGVLAYGFGAPYPALSPLFLAIREAGPEVVKLLLQFKADANSKSPTGVPLIFWIVNQPEILKAFLDTGAKPNVKNQSECTPLSVASSAATVNLLLAAGADIENGCGNRSPLLVIVEQGDNKWTRETSEALLKSGANVMARDSMGQTPLHRAANARAPELIALLISYKADVNARDNNGMTPLDMVTGSREKSRQHIGSGSVYPFDDPALNEKTAALLRQHGGLRDLPKTDRIEVRRPESGYSKTVFIQGTNDWNRFTLLEALFGNYYTGKATPRGFGPDGQAGPFASRMFPLDSSTTAPPFPDLHRVVVVRPDKAGQPAKRIPVDLLLPAGAIKCDSDIPLQFGDIVEIPEREHTLQEATIGLTRDQLEQIVQCREGTVDLAVRGKRIPMKVGPTQAEAVIGPVLERYEARQALFSSSDLSRVKVTRRDPAGGKPREWIIDCSAGKAPDLWLRDGDVIEVPDKQ